MNFLEGLTELQNPTKGRRECLQRDNGKAKSKDRGHARLPFVQGNPILWATVISFDYWSMLYR
jgi:hypothetical protein